MIVASETSARTVMFLGRPGRCAHWDTGLFGSASIAVTVAPLRASSVASTTAEGDFPAPPFGLAKTMTGMRPPPRESCASLIVDRRVIRRSTESFLVPGGYLHSESFPVAT